MVSQFLIIAFIQYKKDREKFSHCVNFNMKLYMKMPIHLL